MRGRPFTINGFEGVDNRHAPEDLIAYAERAARATSRLPVGKNVDISDSLKLRRRVGFAQTLSGNYHSLWANADYSFAVKDYQLIYAPLGAATALRSASSREVSYADTGAGVYISDGQFIGRYLDGAYADLARAGTYDRPTSTLDPTDEVDAYDSPPPGTILLWAFGRLWVVTDWGVAFSRAYRPDQVNLVSDYWDMPGVTLLAAVDDGLYVGTSTEIMFFAGTDPKKATPLRTVIQAGAVARTQVMTTADKLGTDGGTGQAVLFESTIGKLAGYSGGRIRALTDQSLSYAVGATGASFLREINGMTQHISSLPARDSDGSNMRTTDTAVAEVRRNGILI